jgi:ADP-ribose pyrophosphatase
MIDNETTPPDASADVAHWEEIGSTEAFHNRWLHITLDTVRLPDGQSYEYTTIRRQVEGVGVIGFNAAGQVLLQREYRHPVGQVIWQVPGGLTSPGEDRAACAARELREETGYEAETLEHLGSFWDNPALGNMVNHLFLGRNLQPTGRVDRDASEFVSNHWVSVDWLKQAVVDGTIKDRVVVCGLAFLWLSPILDFGF